MENYMSNESNLRKWVEVRKKGKWSYIFNYGVLRFGISTWAMMMVYFWVFHPFEERLIFTIVSFLTFPLAGLAWGRWMWYYMEKITSRLSTPDGDEQ